MGERLLKLHFPPSIVRCLRQELPHGGRPPQHPRLTSCVLSPTGLTVTLLLPYPVIQQLERLDAGLPLQDPRTINTAAAAPVVITSSPEGPNVLRSSDSSSDGEQVVSAFRPVVPSGPASGSVQTVLPDSTTPDSGDIRTDMSFEDMVLGDEAADEEVRMAMMSLAASGTAQPSFTPDLECHESLSRLEVDQSILHSPSVICDVCGHLNYTSVQCPRCSMESMCQAMAGKLCQLACAVCVCAACLSGSDYVLTLFTFL